MAELPETHLIFEKLGDINATLREVKHVTNQNSMKIDALGMIVANQGAIVDKVDNLSISHEKHNVRITALEAAENRRLGAIGLMSWFSKNWPFTVVAAAIIAFVAWANQINITP